MSSQSEKPLPDPLVTIVLPMYNEEKRVGRILSGLSLQAYDNYEIVIVDDGSTDGTFAEAEKLAAGRANTRVVRTEHGGLTHARNVGTRNARGGIIFFAEADCVYNPDYLRRAIRSLEANPGASAVCLTGAPLKLRSTVATECIEIENKIQHKLLETGKIKPFYAWVFRKDALEHVGGFDEELFQGEDKDMFRRIEASGYGVVWVPGIHWRHERDQSLAELASKWFKRGQSRVLYVRKHRLVRDMFKTLLPLWITIVGIGFLFLIPIAGVALLFFVLASFGYQTLRRTAFAWDRVEKKRFFAYYFPFLLVRNFASGLGYTVGIIKIALGLRISV